MKRLFFATALIWVVLAGYLQLSTPKEHAPMKPEITTWVDALKALPQRLVRTPTLSERIQSMSETDLRQRLETLERTELSPEKLRALNANTLTSEERLGIERVFEERQLLWVQLRLLERERLNQKLAELSQLVKEDIQ